MGRESCTMPIVLMPIKAQFAEAILKSKTKEWELRRKAPRIPTPFRVLLVISGTGGQIWGEFTCDKICQFGPREARNVIDKCGITMREFYGYLGGVRHMNFLHVSNPLDYTKGMSKESLPNIRQLGYSRTPQTWLYIREKEVTI